MKRRGILFFLLIYFCFYSCRDADQPGRDDRLYFDYLISGQEDDNAVTVLLQFHLDDISGPTVFLDSGAKVELDGEEIEPDSSRLTGVFYEIQKQAADFEGNHTIVFSGPGTDTISQAFEFRRLMFIDSFPISLKRGNLSFRLSGSKPGDIVRVMLTDTSSGDGINHIDTLTNDKIELSVAELNRLVNGPIHLELTLENESFIQLRKKEKGRITVMYGVSREFELHD